MARTALLLGALAVSTVLGSGAALADVRLECDVEGPRDISLSAKYEERTRTGRQKFSAEFEAAPRAGYTAGQRIGDRGWDQCRLCAVEDRAGR